MTRDKSLQGDFTRESIPGLLQYLGMLDSTGELELDAGSAKALVCMERGRVVDARLGAKSGQEALFEALTLDNGTFAFTPGATGHKATIDSSLDNLLLHAAYWQDTRAAEAPLDGGSVPALVASATGDRLTLEPAQWRVAARVDGRRSLDEIAAALGLDLAEVRSAVRALEGAGLVEVRPRPRQPVEPAFFEEVRARLASLIGPMARIAMQDAAAGLGVSPETLEVSQVGAYLERLAAEVPPARRERFRGLAGPLARRYGQG